MSQVIAQEDGVVGVAGRIEGNDHQDVRAGAIDHHAFLFDCVGQLGLGLTDAVLRVDLHDVHVGADVEVHVQRQLAVVGVEGLHVEQLVHAVDLGLDGRGHGLHDRLGRRAAVGRGDLDHRRADRRILRDGQPLEGNRPHDHRQDGDDHRNDGSANEKVGHTVTPYRAWPRLPVPASPLAAGRPRPPARRSWA